MRIDQAAAVSLHESIDRSVATEFAQQTQRLWGERPELVYDAHTNTGTWKVWLETAPGVERVFASQDYSFRLEGVDTIMLKTAAIVGNAGPVVELGTEVELLEANGKATPMPRVIHNGHAIFIEPDLVIDARLLDPELLGGNDVPAYVESTMAGFALFLEGISLADARPMPHRPVDQAFGQAV